jgi:hypothetical protein
MKKFLFVLIWISLASAVLFPSFDDSLSLWESLNDPTSMIAAGIDWISFWVIYIAWRVTPTSTQPQA